MFMAEVSMSQDCTSILVEQRKFNIKSNTPPETRQRERDEQNAFKAVEDRYLSLRPQLPLSLPLLLLSPPQF